MQCFNIIESKEPSSAGSLVQYTKKAYLYSKNEPAEHSPLSYKETIQAVFLEQIKPF